MKKSLKLLTCGVICMSTFAWKVNAEEVNITDVASLESCVAKTGNICKLDNDISLSSTINIKDGVEVTIDLNNHNIDSTTDTVDPLFYINDGSLVVTGEGTVTAPKDAFSLLGNTVPGEDDIKAELEIDADVEVVSNTSNCVYLKGKGAKVDVYGNLLSKGTYATIQGNGSVSDTNDNGNTVINIYDGASVINENSLAIYHPQSGQLTVNGGTIEGTTGIEMRAGELVVKGGTITGTYVPTDAEANDNGSTTEGAGIAISQHTTLQDLTVTVTGGTIQGYTALYESNPQENTDEAISKVSIEISGGNFEAINNGTNAVYSENVTNFITGGEFSTNVTKLSDGTTTNYVSSELNVKEENGVFVVEKENIEETKSEETTLTTTNNNPKTSDGIMKYFIISIISALGLMISSICVTKKQN